MLQRVLRVVMLALGSGITAEFLLGDQWLLGRPAWSQQLAMIVLFTVFYGSGAVLIRETARRAGGGWPMILLLALAFGLLEEGVVDQSLFNPHYLGLDLLSYGRVPALGIGLPWTVFVLSLHVIWSIGAPIAVTEGLFPRPTRRWAQVAPGSQAPWLGRIGLAVVSVGYLLGAAAVFGATWSSEHFVAAAPQLATSLVLAAALVVVALWLPRRPSRVGGSYWLGVVLGLVATTAYELVMRLPKALSPWLVTTLLLAVLGAGGAAVIVLRPDVVGLASGAVLTYGWVGLTKAVPLGGVAVAEQVVLVTLAVGVLVAAGVRWTRAAHPTYAETGLVSV